jgi:hypothetical protein
MAFEGFPAGAFGFYERLMASGGFHSHAPDQVERYREAVDSERPGRELAS